MCGVTSTRADGHPGSPALFVRLLISWLTNAVVLAIVTVVLADVRASDAGALLAAAAVFGVLNTLLKPLLRLVTLPLAILTFGIAWFFVSMLMLVITDAIVGGFDIHGFWTLVEATLIVWVVNLVLDFVPGPWQVTGHRRRRQASHHLDRNSRRRAEGQGVAHERRPRSVVSARLRCRWQQP